MHGSQGGDRGQEGKICPLAIAWRKETKENRGHEIEKRTKELGKAPRRVISTKSDYKS